MFLKKLEKWGEREKSRKKKEMWYGKKKGRERKGTAYVNKEKIKRTISEEEARKERWRKI